MLEAQELAVRLGGSLRLDAVSVSLQPGTLMAVIGPNGAGKSTLLRAISGELKPERGRVTIGGRPAGDWRRLLLARQMAVMGQTPVLAFDFTVRELVALGRAPHRGTPLARHDKAFVATAIELAGLKEFAERSVPTLSGGERQRAFFAKAVAQLMTRPGQLPGAECLLLLDEPTAALDLAQQARVLGAARRIADAGSAVLAVLHDLNLAAAYADRILVLVDGKCVGAGRPDEVLLAEHLGAWYGCPVDVLADTATGRRLIAIRRS